MMSSLPALTSESAGPAGGHAPVLLEPALRALNLRGDGCYVDATFGRGGHSRAILERLGPAGQLVVFDQDPEALAVARELAAQDARVEVVAANFSGLQEALAGLGLVGCIDGLLMDLGVSSPQLDDGRRGFSFRFEGPLDMRMNPEAGESVAQWLARADEVDIANVLYRYGEERRSRRIARRIVEARAEEPLTGTLQLAEIISRAVGGRRGQKIHPATRSFQALRIFINRELEVLEQALPQALDVLAPGGRLAVISFHSLEDRIVKQFLRAAAQPPAPDVLSAPPPGRIGRPRRERCDELEARRNPRARSATLRWAELRA